jgi:alpha-N-arabinofuranosidase
MKRVILYFLLGIVTSAFAQNNQLIINADLGTETINKNIYGHFSEHLGHCIYGGIWVGKDSPIPNTDGVRNDIIQALKNIQIPVLRWPGGCFADEYHWMDGIGPKENRVSMINTHWGGVVEDNSFGTHEFLNFCEQIGADAYLAGNLGSGTVKEMSEWVEYVNAETGPMADLRKQNGREKPWSVKYWGVGNENWGCGGNMTPEFYADQYKRFATYCRNYGDNRLYRVASGASDYDYQWTETMMKNAARRMQGLSLHYYTVKDWSHKGSATNFTEQDYIETLIKCLDIENVLKRHIAIMDQYDPDKRIGLMVDEWGAWWDVEPGTNPGFLYQQNTMQDAFVAAITLNIFNEHCDRVKMANLAQTVNVLQSLILTNGDKMILTPTYYVFDLYKVHQNATYLPSNLHSEDYQLGDKKIPALYASSSKAEDGTIHISLVNVNPDKAIELICDLRGGKFKKASGKILTAPELNSHNTFEQPDNVTIKDFNKLSVKNEHTLNITVPAKSVMVLSLK